MSIWDDLFSIYQSVQSGNTDNRDAVDVPKQEASKTTDADTTESQQTVYVFAYIDDGKGNISRNIAVEDRITMLEMKNQELEYRYNKLLEQLEEESDEDD